MNEVNNIVRKKYIFYASVLLMFITSMSKVLVPGTIFDELQGELGISGSMLAAMGAAFMYTYGISQLALGLLSSKYGGVRILLFGALVFASGSMVFPFLNSPVLMVIARAVAGLGAGTVFVGLAKIMADIFPENFSMVLGIVLFITYFGPVCGGLPMVSLVKCTSWRIAMGVPGVVAVIILAVIIIFMKGTMKPVLKGDTFAPLFFILKNKNSWFVFAASSVIFGSYYTILTTVGLKMLTDAGNFKAHPASIVITVMAIIVACNNIFGNIILKMLGSRRKIMMLTAGGLHVAGTVLCMLVFYFNWHGLLIIAGFVLIAFPAGFFSIYCTVIKELQPPEYTGLAIAILNFFAFAAIAVWGNIAGAVLAGFEDGNISGVVNYPPQAYGMIFAIFSIFAAAGLIASFYLPETWHKKNGQN